MRHINTLLREIVHDVKKLRTPYARQIETHSVRQAVDHVFATEANACNDLDITYKLLHAGCVAYALGIHELLIGKYLQFIIVYR